MRYDKKCQFIKLKPQISSDILLARSIVTFWDALHLNWVILNVWIA